MDEYIKKDDVLNLLRKNSITKKITLADGVSIYDSVKNIPTVDVAPRAEVIDEFVKRLLDAFPEPHRGGNLCPAIYYDDYREIIEELAVELKEAEGNK